MLLTAGGVDNCNISMFCTCSNSDIAAELLATPSSINKSFLKSAEYCDEMNRIFEYNCVDCLRTYRDLFARSVLKKITCINSERTQCFTCCAKCGRRITNTCTIHVHEHVHCMSCIAEIFHFFCCVQRAQFGCLCN